MKLHLHDFGPVHFFSCILSFFNVFFQSGAKLGNDLKPTMELWSKTSTAGVCFLKDIAISVSY